MRWVVKLRFLNILLFYNNINSNMTISLNTNSQKWEFASLIDLRISFCREKFWPYMGGVR